MATDSEDLADVGLSFSELAEPLLAYWRLVLFGPIAAGLLALGITYVIPPTYTASTTFIPPQQGQSAVASALAALGPLASLAGGGASSRSPAEQYVALLQSVTVADRIIDEYKLLDIYDDKYRVDARKDLGRNVHVTLGKKDGLISVEVDDRSPQRAAAMANSFVDALRAVTARLAVTEAQQRRMFFEQQLAQTRERLVQAQQALQDSGFNPGALKTEPKAAVDAYARLKADIAAAEVRLQSLRGTLTDKAPEVRQQQAALSTLRDQLARTELSTQVSAGPDYVGKYRDFKYEEALFELYARQLESARVDESHEGALIQVVDPAMVPERKSRPKRALIALVTVGVAFLVIAGAAHLLWRRSPTRGSADRDGGSTAQ